MQKKSLSRTFELPSLIRKAHSTFSPFEKVLLFVFAVLLFGSTLGILGGLNSMLVSDIPAHGGSHTEGIIGFPRFINPLLATTDADRDLSMLVYSGLLKARPDGSLAPDLAQRFEVSEDGLTYHFFIRDDAVFHDGTPVTADDVLFTVSRAQDPALKSPRRASWDGVAVEKVSEKEVVFTLTRPYAPFLENATLGILPSHLWKEVEIEQFPFSQLNTEAIGSGPYRITDIKRNKSGVPERYTLSSFAHYTLGEPYIEEITLSFYSNEDDLIAALKNGDVESVNSIAPAKAAALTGYTIKTVPLPRTFGIFFNQNQAPALANIEVRKALSLATDRERIVREVLNGYGIAINTPIPPGLIAREKVSVVPEQDLEEAQAVLERNGWVRNEETGIWSSKDDGPLSVSISTSNVPELKAAAQIVMENWLALGADVHLQIFEPSDLNVNSIRPRKYDALLFGEIIGRTLDLFAFWHSSQRNDPGLNVALYANITADRLLEEGRVAQDRKERDALYNDFEEEVANDQAAVFLYAPEFIYVTPERIRGVTLGTVTVPADRFLSVQEWFVETDQVWHFFK